MRPLILQEGSHLADVPIVVRAKVSPIQQSIADIFATPIPLPIDTGKTERVRLRWMEPDGFGGLKEL